MSYTIAIAGGSGAGKTTIARRLAALLGSGCTLIAEDDYYRCRTTIAGFDETVHDFDAPASKDHDLLAAHLAMARRGEAFDKPLYDFTTHTRLSRTERIAAQDYIVLDGLHALAPPLRAAIDLAVFVEADESLRLARRLVRDVQERGRSADSVYRQFFRTVLPAHAASVAPQKVTADLVLVSTFEGDFSEAEALAMRIFEEVGVRIGR